MPGTAAAARLAACGAVHIEPGLSAGEFARVEEMLGFEFADDHRAFLVAGLPAGNLWPNWRSEGRKSLQKRMQLPIDGVLFAVEWNEFWVPAWGQRPARMTDALRTANYQMARVPRLVPVYSHRYLPAGRGSSGHPVLSVVRTDVVALGRDLADYIANEFSPGVHCLETSTPGVDFWSELVT